MVTPLKTALAGSALGLSLILASCTTASTPQAALEAKVLNSLIWPEEATRFVRTGDEPKLCLETVDTVFIVNDEDSMVFMNDGSFYYNRLQLPCNNVLITGATVPAGFGQSQICAGNSVTLPDRFRGFSNAQCHLGSFEPIRVADAGETDAITVNEGVEKRIPRLTGQNRATK
ncbi:MAG: hypothetical protein AAFO28_04710 [Pseudomonadota bacterium]